MTLQMRPGMIPFIADENGHISMTNDTANWLVIVTREGFGRHCISSVGDVGQAPRLRRHLRRPLSLSTSSGEEETIWVQFTYIAELSLMPTHAIEVVRLARPPIPLPDFRQENSSCPSIFSM
jgi:hypothetical protein